MHNGRLIDSIFQFMFTFRSQLSHELNKAQLSAAPMHMKLLKMIDRMEHCTAQEIARALNRDKAQINRAVQEIVTKGYVSKANNPQDKRSHLLVLTSKGKEVLQLMNEIEIKLLQKMSNNIPQADIEKFITTLDKFRQNL